MLQTGYKFVIASEGEHEKVFIEIYVDDKFIAVINQENGPDNLEIKFPGTDLIESLITRNCPLKTFLELVDEAVIKIKRLLISSDNQRKCVPQLRAS